MGGQASRADAPLGRPAPVAPGSSPGTGAAGRSTPARAGDPRSAGDRLREQGSGAATPGRPGRVLCLWGELQCADQRLLHEIHTLGLDGVFERGEILESLGSAPAAGVAELRGLGFRSQGPGELADQRVQADPLLVQLLDQPDIVQTLEGTLEQRRGIARPAGQRHAREQAERGDRDGRGLGERPGDPEDEPRRFIAWPQVPPTGSSRSQRRRPRESAGS